MTFAAIIVAAGRGSRAGGEIAKQFRPLRGTPVLAWSVEAFAAAGVSPIIVVAPQGEEAVCRAALQKATVTIVTGGATRTASVRAGLESLGEADVVFIHDAARPGLSLRTIEHLRTALSEGAEAAAPALPVTDALHRCDERGQTAAAVSRDRLWRVQTPQAFYTRVIKDAYASTGETVFDDDIGVAAAAGARVRFIEGDVRLMKLTYPEDFAVFERLIGGVVCVGSGFDAHRFGPGEHVTLCGVRVAHEKGLVGHSDADAGWHALVDAILGALGEGDIGAHFPPSDAQWEGAASERFLRHAAELASAKGGRIVHVDITLICERPRIGPHREAMRARTAEVLGIAPQRVSIKATTTERMGFTGREEGLAAQATATLELPQ